MKLVGGALRDRLVAWGRVNERIFRDRRPENSTLPAITFIDPLSDTPALSGDGRVLAKSRVVQLDLWQKAAAEDDSLLASLERELNGGTLVLTDEDDNPVAAFTTRWRSTVRVPDPDRLLVHHALTVAVAHRGSI